jgi:hypothetical protein
MIKRIENMLLAAAVTGLLTSPVHGFGQSSSGAVSQPIVAQLSDQKPAPTQNSKTFFGESFAGHWTLDAETNVSQEYDDNVFSSNLIRLSDNATRFSMRMSAAVQKKRLRVQIHYFPNYVLYAKYSDRNSWTHQYSHEILYKSSNRTDWGWSLSASRSPSSSNSPFQFVDFSGVVLPVFHPEALQSNATIFNANSSLTWSHKFSARNTLNVSLQGNVVRFYETAGAPLSALSAQKSFSTGVDLKWESEIVPRRKLGLEVGDTYFGFLDPGSHSHYQFLKGRFSQDFSRGFKFSVGAGPSSQERQIQPGISAALRQTGYAVDASLTKTSQNHTLGVTYNHGSQLGQTQGGLSSDTVAVSAMTRILKKWRASGGFSYSRSSSATILQQGTTDSYSPNSTLEYQFSPEFSATAGYSYINQVAPQITPVAQGFDRNLFTIGLHYTFRIAAGK